MEQTLPLSNPTTSTTDSAVDAQATGVTGGRFLSVELFATACLHLPSVETDAAADRPEAE